MASTHYTEKDIKELQQEVAELKDALHKVNNHLTILYGKVKAEDPPAPRGTRASALAAPKLSVDPFEPYDERNR